MRFFASLKMTIRVLFCFLMQGVLPAVPAIFFHFQPVFQDFFVLVGKIIDFFANRALKFNQVILRHKNIYFICYFLARSRNRTDNLRFTKALLYH